MSGKPEQSETIESRFARTNILTFLPSSPAAPPRHPLPGPAIPAFLMPPFGYDVGRVAPWGVYMNWCPVEGHLWTAKGSTPSQYGDGITACPDHDGWPAAESEEMGQ